MTDPVTENVRPVMVDAHLDVAYNAVALGRDLNLPIEDIRRVEKTRPPADPAVGVAMVSWPALVEGRIAVIGGSLFVEPWVKSRQQLGPTYRTPDEAHDQAARQLDYYRRIEDERDDVAIIATAADLDAVLQSWETEHPVTGVFVVMEGADPIRDPGELRWWLDQGLRGIGLSWAAGTRYAGGNANPGPLTDEGEALTLAMADANLLLDVSHLAEAALTRVLDRYPGPVVATHANPRTFVDSPRSLSDDTIRRIAEREGVVGMVAYNHMLDARWRPGEPRLPLARLVEMIDHVCQVTGQADFVGIGSDLDGGFGQASTPEELDSVADLGKIAGLLRERGYEEADVRAIVRGNWLRVMRAALAAF